MKARPSILFLKDGPIARIVLANAERHNSLGRQEINLFMQYLADIENDPDVRVLLLSGEGEKTFCAGASLDELSSGELEGEQFALLPQRLAELSLPTICALNGSVYGGGFELALACDFRVAKPGIRTFIPAAKFGLCYPATSVQRLVSVLGVNASKRLLLACEELDVGEMLQLGVLTHQLKGGNLDEFCQSLALKLSKMAPLALNAMKQLINGFACAELHDADALALAAKCNTSQDYLEGMAAIREGRAAVFSGK